MPIYLPSNTAATTICSGLLFTLLTSIHTSHAQVIEPPLVVKLKQQKISTVEFPLASGWHEGRVVQYISTDASDKETARKLGVNFAPRLADALPAQPRVPGQPSFVERIYTFVNVKQGSVLASVPLPTGSESASKIYSPLWQLHTVTWLPGHPLRLLRSEEEVLAAADKKEVEIRQTNIVVNCPVVFSEQGGRLEGIKIRSE